MAGWSDRLQVKTFNLLGGEPTIHPQLSEFVPLVRRHWPAARICIVTNGFFLHRHPDLPSTLAAAGNAELALSVHHDGAGYMERLRPVFDLLANWQRDHGTIVRTRLSQQNLDAPLPRLWLRHAPVRGRTPAAKLEDLSGAALQATA